MGLAIRMPTMPAKSRRHQAFRTSRSSCPASIRHQELKTLAVLSVLPQAMARGAVYTSTPTTMYRSAASTRSFR